MSFLKKDKKYGLIIPKTSRPGSGKVGKSASIFQNDSSEEDESKKKTAINLELNAVAEKKKQTKQTKEEIERALKEDPNVYKYDEIYDEMEEKKAASHKEHKETDKKPKYIANLLKSAAMRKREQERRVERGVQKEREKEGDEFADKESFVTSAYRQKMIDQAEEDERLRKQDELDAQHDVMKQKDLSQFYRNLLDRNVAMGAAADPEEPERPEETKDKARRKRSKDADEYSNKGSSGSSEEEVRLDRTSKKMNRSEISERKDDNQKSDYVEGQRLRQSGRRNSLKHSDKVEYSASEEKEMQLKRQPRKRSLSREDKAKGDRHKSHRMKGQRPHHSVKRSRSKPSDRSASSASESDDSNVIKPGKKISLSKGKRDTDKATVWKDSGKRIERNRSASRSSSSESEDEKKSQERNAHRRGESYDGHIKGESKVRKSNKTVSKKEEPSSRKTVIERRRRSYSDNSSSEKEAKGKKLKSEQRSRTSTKGYDFKDFGRKRSKERRYMEDDKRRHHSDRKKHYKDSSSDPDIERQKEKLKSSDHSNRKSTDGRYHVDQKKFDKSGKKSSGGRTEEERKGTVRNERLKVFAKRNDSETVLSARERYLARKKARIVPDTYDDESDD